MNRLLLLAVPALVLSACSDGNSDAAGDNAAGAPVAPTAGTDATDAPDSGATSDVKLPAGFTIYPGAEVQDGTSFTDENGEGGLINMTASASPKEMIEFYRKQAKVAGAKVTLDSTAGDRMMLAGEKDGGVKFTFNAGVVNGKTEAQLMIGEGL